jgi:hypothetical protein
MQRTASLGRVRLEEAVEVVLGWDLEHSWRSRWFWERFERGIRNFAMKGDVQSSASHLSFKISFPSGPALPRGHILNVALFCSGSRRFGSEQGTVQNCPRPYPPSDGPLCPLAWWGGRVKRGEIPSSPGSCGTPGVPPRHGKEVAPRLGRGLQSAGGPPGICGGLGCVVCSLLPARAPPAPWQLGPSPPLPNPLWLQFIFQLMKWGGWVTAAAPGDTRVMKASPPARASSLGPVPSLAPASGCRWVTPAKRPLRPPAWAWLPRALGSGQWASGVEGKPCGLQV